MEGFDEGRALNLMRRAKARQSKYSHFVPSPFFAYFSLFHFSLIFLKKNDSITGIEPQNHIFPPLLHSLKKRKIKKGEIYKERYKWF